MAAKVKYPKKTAKALPTAEKKKKTKVARHVSHGTCFILMPFKEPFETYYSAIIRPAVEDAKFDPIRGDSIFRPSPIMADIWQMIQDAKILVAELTEKNANVFYELGLAHALGKPVILIAETMSDVPFDLQALRVILYDKNVPDWGTKLRGAIKAYLAQTLRDTASAIPGIFRKTVKSQAPPQSELAGRLAALEQQVTALRQGSFRGASEPVATERMPIGDVITRLQNTKTRTELVGVVAELIRTGRFPTTLIQHALLANLPTGEAERIVREARTLARQ